MTRPYDPEAIGIVVLLGQWAAKSPEERAAVLRDALDAAHAAGLAQGRAEMLTARPLDDWHEDIGAVLWWAWPVREPPYAGTPLDDDFPEYMTHWTPIVCPERALPDTSEESERG